MNQPFRFSAIFTWVLVLFSATIQTAQAQILPTSCSTTTMDMKLLVISNGKTESDFPAIRQILDYLGTPYDVLDMTVNTGGITSSMLSDGKIGRASCREGCRYRGMAAGHNEERER